MDFITICLAIKFLIYLKLLHNKQIQIIYLYVYSLCIIDRVDIDRLSSTFSTNVAQWTTKIVHLLYTIVYFTVHNCIFFCTNCTFYCTNCTFYCTQCREFNRYRFRWDGEVVMDSNNMVIQGWRQHFRNKIK